MVKTVLREYGTSVIAGSEGDEEIIPAKGDGNALPGEMVAILSTGKVAGTDAGAVESFAGILMESDITGPETAIVDGIPCDVVVPKSGHRYNVRILDLNAAAEIGDGLDFSATPGYMDAAADIIHAVATAARPIADGDTVAQVHWRR